MQYSNKQYVEVGDVVEFDICNTEPENHQTENIVINPLSMPKKHFLQLNNIKQLRSFFSSDDVIYGNTERFIGFERVKGKIFNSIGLYKVNDLCIYQKSPDKYGANFKYNGKEYKDLPVTDPKYKKNANKTISNAVIMVTLTKPWFDQSNKEYRCYKIIATIFENLDVLPTIH